MARHTILMSA